MGKILVILGLSIVAASIAGYTAGRIDGDLRALMQQIKCQYPTPPQGTDAFCSTCGGGGSGPATGGGAR